MIKKISIIIVFLLLICGISTADNYIINDDTVYIDDSEVYLSATPHTLSSSGWVYFNLTSKVYTGDIDVVWGFNTTVSKPTKAELYKPYWINTTVDDQKTFYNPTFIIYTGDELDYGNPYNTNYRYTITEKIINDNGTIYISSNAAFDSFDTDGTNYTVYWYTRHDNYYLWKDFSSSFNSVIYDYNGFNKWYYIKNISVISGKKYLVRGWIDIPVSIKKQSGKYYFAIKPSHETISQAITKGHFYNLDPWWNAIWSNRKNITLIGNTSGAQTDYQLLLNVTYDSDMQSNFDDLRFCNETHELDSWLESKVDGSYALVWVEFPTTPANTIEQTYYMYYGNAGAASDWDIGSTMIFGDDFLGDLSKWSGDTLQFTISGGELTNTPSTTCRIIYTNVESIFNTIIESKIKTTDASTDFFFGLGYRIDTSNRAYFNRRQVSGYERRWGDGTVYYSTIPPQWTSGVYGIDKVIIGTTVANSIHSFDETTVAGVSNFNSDISTNVLIRSSGTGAPGVQYVDWIFVHKYVTNPAIYVFGSEESVLYTPPDPISLMNTTGNFWVNHTWLSGSGNITDSYNVSVNTIWYNTTTNTFYNDTYTPHAWQNITVWAYNSTGISILSIGSISQDTQIPNNPITITNTSDWTGNAGEVVYVDYDATDADSDTATFSCNRIDLFTDFDTSAGKGNWTATANIYYVDFGVSDGYGSISNYTMTLTELSFEITLLDELGLIMSEITSELKGINMGNYLVYAFILIGILLIIFLIRILNNCIYGE